MTAKDRKVQLLLSCFYLLAAAYLGFRSVSTLYASVEQSELFINGPQGLPVLSVTISLIGCISSLISSFGLFMRVRWVNSLALFTSGILLCYSVGNLSSILKENPYESIPLVLMVIVVLQSFSYLMRSSYRSL